MRADVPPIPFPPTYDLLHFMNFLQEQQLTYLRFRPPHALLFLEYFESSFRVEGGATAWPGAFDYHF